MLLRARGRTSEIYGQSEDLGGAMTWVYTCMYTHVVCTYTNTYIHRHGNSAHGRDYTPCACAHIKNIDTYMNAWMYTKMHTYIQTYIHTHMHISKHMLTYTHALNAGVTEQLTLARSRSMYPARHVSIHRQWSMCTLGRARGNTKQHKKRPEAHGHGPGSRRVSQ